MKKLDRRIRAEMDRVAARFRHLRFVTTLAIVWLAVAITAALLREAGQPVLPPSSDWPLAIGAAILLAAALSGWIAWRSVSDYRWLARRIERWRPALNARLLTAIEQEPLPPQRQLSYLQESVVRETLADANRGDWRQLVPRRRLWTAHAAHLLALTAMSAALAGLFGAGPLGARRNAAQSRGPTVISDRYEVEIEPGDAQVERGSSLLVLARFSQSVPSGAALSYSEASGGEKQLAMSRSLDDPLFGVRIDAVREDLSYQVEFGGQKSRRFQVTVFEYPRLERADARLEFPEYTSMGERLIEDTRRVDAVEGASLTLICRLNKPVADARLTDEAGAVLQLSADGADATVYRTTFVVKQSQRFRLHLTDGDGRRNKDPDEIVVNALANQRPELKLAWPRRDTRVSPLEELQLKASMWDDFGLQRYGLSFSLGGQPPQELMLGDAVAGKERRQIEQVLDFESLQAQPDQLVSYYFWAEDADPQGRPRRTFGDMYFAEVRHFEEIFRQGQQQPGGSEEQQQQQQQQQGGQNAQQAEQLAELQKQIASGVWNVIRRETGERLSDQFAGDTALLRDSQQSAIEQADQLGEQLQDAESLGHLEAAKQHMQTALQQLTEAAAGPSLPAHQQALPAAQAAYEGLLKLRAREHRVTRGRQQGGQSSSGGASSRSDMQLQQLELDNSENRYETQRTASEQQSQTDRETRQVLNRLRELASRQGDLNDRLKELQSALEEAQSEDERQRIRQELQRLREQQQEILRDVDELRSRMEQPANQERMGDARQQLEQTRSNVRRASEALEQGMVSQAAAAGARAQQQLNELRDEFREQAAGQFSEQMKQMRQDARELDQKQQELAQALDGLEDFRAQSLREPHQRQEVLDGLGDQQQKLENLLEEMRDTVREAEEAEPLLAKQLYDTVRQASQQRVEDALKSTRQMLERGFLNEAAEPERLARQGIEQLRRGVERAAENVLGNDVETLRRARDELGELAEQLRQEITAQSGQARPEQLAQAAGGRRPPAGENQPSDTPPQDQQGQPNERASAPNPAPAAGGGQPRSPSPGDSPPQPGSSRQPSESANNASGGSRPGEPQDQPPDNSANSAPGNSPNDSPNDSPNNSQDPRPGEGARRPGADQQAGGGARAEQDGWGGGGPGAWERFLQQEAGTARPLTGDQYRQWSDRLRDVEEMLDDSALRADLAQIRARARDMRAELKRHSKEPNWDLVQSLIAVPLVEVQQRVAETLLNKTSQETLTPIDRDPVPVRYAEEVQRYYERLGSGE